MAGGFLSGFAEGYLTERKRRTEREQDLEDQSFQYRMKYLTDQREKRDAKKLKEVELSKKAKSLAEMAGDPDFASTAYKELSNDVSYETLQKRIQDGMYQKNPNYVAPTKTVKVPEAVSMEPYDSQFPANEKINKRIDAIDPTLRIPKVEDNNYTTIAQDDGNPYLFKPKEQKIGDYDQAQYELLKAKESNDPAAMREAETKLKAHEIALTREAAIKARAEGKSAKIYIMKDKNGRMTSTFTGEIRDGNLWNTSVPTVDGYGNTGKIVSAEDMNSIQEVSPEAFEAMEKLEYEFGKQSSDLREGMSNYVGVINTSQKMISLLNQSPEVTSITASGVELARDMTEEAKIAYQVVFGKENEIKEKFKSGDMNGLEKMITEYEQDVETLVQKSSKDGGIMGASNQRIASDKAIYDSLRNLLTFQMAAANGVSGAKMSDKDFDKFWDMVGGDKRDPNDVIRAIQNSSQVVLTTIDGHRQQINNHPAVKGFQVRYGFDPGVQVPRVEDLLIDMGREDLIPTFRELTGKAEMGKINAVVGAQNSAIDKTPEAGAIPSGDIDILKANPSDEYKKFFDEVYGPGAADRVLGE